jgi:hypothetical protein
LLTPPLLLLLLLLLLPPPPPLLLLQRVRVALEEAHDPSAVRTSLLLEDDPTYK